MPTVMTTVADTVPRHLDMPYPFQPYEFTAFDHVSPAYHMFLYLEFGKPSVHGISALQTGVSRLSEHLPFLTGTGSPSSRPGDKQYTYEAQPVTASFLQKYPMLLVESHPELDGLASNDYINEKYLPVPTLMALTEPAPLLRFKANVSDTKLVLTVAYFHRAMDCMGVSIALKALAALCRDPNIAPDLLPTTAHAEACSRKVLSDFAASALQPLHRNITRGLSNAIPPEDPRMSSTSRRFALSTKNIISLRDVCNKAIHNNPSFENDSRGPYQLTTNDIITAVIGISGTRARLSAFPKTTSTTPAVLGAINVRRYLSVPDTYMGATALVMPTPYNIAAVELSKYFVSSAEIPEALDANDFKHVVNIALGIRRQTNAMSVDYLRDCLRSHVDKPDYPAFNPMHIPSIAVSTFRRMEFYHDFGALGRVQEFDIPDNKLTGCCWVLPETGTRGSELFELRFALEKAALEHLAEDNLLQWVLAKS